VPGWFATVASTSTLGPHPSSSRAKPILVRKSPQIQI
jgi:hypothetical protein